MSNKGKFKTNLNQLGLLLWKNYTLQKRSIIGSILELVIPAFFAIILLPIRGIVKSNYVVNDTLYDPFSVDPFPPGLKPKSPIFSYRWLEDGYKDEIYADNKWCLGYAPNDNAVINNVMRNVADTYNFTLNSFTTEELMVEFVTDSQNYAGCLGGIAFLDTNPANFTYKIRLSYSPRSTNRTGAFANRDWKTNLLYLLFPILGPREKKQNDGGDPGYYREGFLTLQKAIDINLISQYSTNVSSVSIFLDRFPYPPYNDDNFVLVIQGLFPFIIMLSFVFTVILTAKAIAYEKERGIKEAMKLMGMKTWIYWLSWYLKTLILILPAVIFMIISFKIQLSVKGGGRAAILNQTNPIILTIFFFLYVSSSITFTFLMTTFFKKANSAAAGAGIIWFLSYLPYIFISQRYEKLNLFTKIIACFVNNLGMSEAVQLIGQFEGKGTGIQWSNINQGISVDDNFTFLQCLCILFVNNFVHLLLTYYFEQINPGDHGIAKPWHFPITALCPKINKINAEEQQISNGNGHHSNGNAYIMNNITNQTYGTNSDGANQVFIEDESSYKSRKIGIKIANIGKVFKQLGKVKTAVKNLSLNIYENHITVLLGHNGAGKSTTISMITGLHKPTQGKILVNDYNIVEQTTEARSQIGYCPQHNLLFDDLTVYEHLVFFSKLKQNYDPNEINSMLKALDIRDKSNAKSKTLSGGMKRKLSVAIAFIGGSKIVILDEPTSGMDPQARHTCWSLLQKFKKEKKCSILLTTHFMDEADYLGDRIAIMSRGELRCCGSPLYLKSIYGSGYNLVLTKKSDGQPAVSTTKIIEKNSEVAKPMMINETDDSSNRIINLVKQHVANAKLNSNINSEISFVLPKEDSSKFANLFTDLEMHKNTLNIVNIGISITTVEEVFLRIGDLEDVDENITFDPTKPTEAITTSRSDANEIAIDLDIENAGLWIGSNTHDRLINSFYFYLQQFWALFVKRMIHSVRNLILVISQIFVPFSTLLIILIYLKYAPIKPEDSPSLDLKLTKYRSNFVPYKVYNDTNINSLKYKLASYFEREFNSLDNAKVFNLIDNKTVSLCMDRRDTIDSFLACIGEYSLGYINDNYVVAASFLDSNNTSSSDKPSMIGHFNNQPFHVPPLALNLLTNTLYKYYTQNANNTINIINHPLPRNLKEKLADLQSNKNAAGFNIGTTLTFGYSFLISSFVVFLIKERVSGSKHIQYLSGANSLIFWSSAFVWDLINYAIPTIISIVLLSVFNIEQFTNGGNLKYVVGLFLLYGLAHIPQAYLMSYLFIVPATGFAVTVGWNILSSQATLTATGILMIPNLDLLDIANALQWVFLALFPNYAFGSALTDMYNNYEAIQACELAVLGCKAGKPNPCCKGFTNLGPNPCAPDTCFEWTPNYMDWDKPGLLRYFVFLPIQFIVQFSIVMIYETGFLRKIIYKIRNIFNRKSIQKSNSERMEIERLYGDIAKDEDVIKEEKRISSLQVSRSQELLLVDRLTKYYSSFMAVKGISFGIKSGETFGLLGVNGAGKTTTFKMLTGDETITRGEAYLSKTSIKTDIKKFQQQLGYCPQFDPLIDQMTVMETLLMFSRLRGIKPALISTLCTSLIKLLDLSDHIGKQCYTLSGGNKRKLSVAISLIGSPVVVLLDEPTSGMDPKTRRFLWNCLNKIRNKGKSLILTTHSMDETEALCTQVGIMVNGELKCLGSLQHLKSKYGEGYTLLVKIALDETNDEKINEFINFVNSTFENSVLKEQKDGFINIHINDNSVKMLANIFSMIEKVKTKYSIEYYAVTQTKLEQIFLNFASKQIDPATRFLNNSGCCSCC